MSEPERPIEKLLRGSATERRDHAGEGWELHPVNRRQLQKEVEATFGSGTKQRQGFSIWFGSFGWSKLTGAIAALAIVGTSIWLVLTSAAHKQDAMLVARNEPATAQNDKAEAASTLDSKSERSGRRILQERELALQPPVEQNSLTKKDQGADRPMGDHVEKETKIISAPALADAAPQKPQPLSNEIPAPPAAPSVNPQSAEDLASSAFRKRYGLSGGVARQAAPLAPANPASNAGKQQAAVDLAVATAAPSAQAMGFDVSRNVDAEALKLSSNLTIQYGYFSSTQNLGRQLRSFQQDNRTATALTAKRAISAKPTPNQVLTYFRLEQSGTELRVLDGDNSIYSGTIKPATVRAMFADYQDELRAKSFPRAASEPDLANSAALQATQKQETPQDYVFQVVGTNLSLKQRVVFSGVLRPGTASASVLFRDDASAGPSAGSAQGFTSPNPTPQQSRYISGTALIGSARQIDIEATPAPAQPPAR